MGINKKNLKRTREYIAEVDDSMIKMYYYREGTLYNPKCNSIGCIVGHATALDAENVKKNFTNKDGIRFESWSREFFGTGRKSKLWQYLFGHQHIDIKDYHLYRMDYILEGNKAPNTMGLFFYEYHFIKYYDDGYFSPIGMKL